MSKRAVPQVLLVGRTNVGKSALFNRISGNDRSLVFGRDGVTRDYIEQHVVWDRCRFVFVDTGGISFASSVSLLEKKVREIALAKLKSADLVLFVCDVTTGVVSEDLDIARLLKTEGKSIFLVLNKADTEDKDVDAGEFYSLGFSELFCVSALHGRGIGDLLDAIATKLPIAHGAEDHNVGLSYKTVIVGKPNVGKSSLLNCLLQEERAIVSDVAGTTREPVSRAVTVHKETIRLVDTAGVRRSRSISDQLETLMVKTSMHAIRGADIVILVVDVTQMELCTQELRLLSYAYEQHKAIIVVFNKVDLIDVDQKQIFGDSIKKYDFLLKNVVTVWTSCVSQRNLSKLKERIFKLKERCNQTVDTAGVTEIVQTTLRKRPLYRQGQLLKIFKVRSIKSDVPTFHLYVNNPVIFGDSDIKCVENIIRANYDLLGCPVRFALRKV